MKQAMCRSIRNGGNVGNVSTKTIPNSTNRSQLDEISLVLNSKLRHSFILMINEPRESLFFRVRASCAGNRTVRLGDRQKRRFPPPYPRVPTHSRLPSCRTSGPVSDQPAARLVAGNRHRRSSLNHPRLSCTISFRCQDSRMYAHVLLLLC